MIHYANPGGSLLPAPPRPLVLSCFPGADLLGRAFELEGYCVVRGPDKILGQDIRTFVPPPLAFEGVIGGSPCQDFSRARRSAPTGYGLAMLAELVRVVVQARPAWFLIENVPTVPTVQVPGYAVQRFDLRASECGLPHRRLRHFQFGSASGKALVIDRGKRAAESVPTPLATEAARKHRRGWPEFCALMGLPPDFDLPALTRGEKYKAVGNGVPIPMGRFVASCIRDCQVDPSKVQLCRCGCGRRVTGHQRSATAACRKRLSRAGRVRQSTPKALFSAEIASQICRLKRPDDSLTA